MSYRLNSVCPAALAAYACGCVVWALCIWQASVFWSSLTALLIVLALVWPILMQLLHRLAAHKPTRLQGRAYAVWMAATVLTTGPVLPRFLVAVGVGCVGGSVLLSTLALVAVHPLLIPLAFVPLALRDSLCAWVITHLSASVSQGER